MQNSILVDGQWGGWYSLNDTECRLENGQWIKPGYRKCNRPPALFGGKPCEGEDETILDCQPSKQYP